MLELLMKLFSKRYALRQVGYKLVEQGGLAVFVAIYQSPYALMVLVETMIDLVNAGLECVLPAVDLIGPPARQTLTNCQRPQRVQPVRQVPERRTAACQATGV
ncbi:hypothetical protein [Pseudomonas petroselini]|uniref:hypothetical protein n=1 Tax=Pseudomonas petroselini TaxID=2899822 RepID=UPI001E55E3E8|nr:hypothetical protein [Pseudomonas petroselini]MCD7047187.1 hypothetical protein [Pseudomonas petroselini]